MPSAGGHAPGVGRIVGADIRQLDADMRMGLRGWATSARNEDSGQ